jgi:Rod binding domain-containing protein
MASIVSTIFDRPLVGGAEKKSDAHQAAQSFSQVFATMLAKEMRKALVGEDKGPMGVGGGAQGDIYASFFDEAMGKALARSAAMKPLNRMVFRELDGAHNPAQTASGAKRAHGAGQDKEGALACGVRETIARTGSSSATLQKINFHTAHAPSTDNRGPVLLPPPANPMAPILPAPSLLEN